MFGGVFVGRRVAAERDAARLTAVPEPNGLKDARVRPDAAYYHRELGEFILPYEAVRTSSSPDADLAAFIDSTYEAAATRARWDRAALER